MRVDNDSLSPLAIDLAISQVNLAAAKARAGIKPTDEERSAAARLKRAVSQQLDALDETRSIPASLVPEEKWRGFFERSLSDRQPVRPTVKRELLSELAQLLDTLDQRKLSKEQANRLIDDLREFRPYTTPMVGVPQLQNTDG